MQQTSTTVALDLPAQMAGYSAKENESGVQTRCFHCGTLCGGSAFSSRSKSFCCLGCQTVFELLSDSGLSDFYTLSENAGVRIKTSGKEEQFAFLDEPSVRERLVNFADARTTVIKFNIPSIHCIACVWLLENLFRIKPGVGRSEVNFLRKEVVIHFETAKVKLSELVALLQSLGYEPDLKFADLEGKKGTGISRRLWLQLGFAGFAFGNIMLLSISSYLGLDSFDGPSFRRLFGYISFALALPVFFYSAADYWKSAWVSLRQKLLNIDVPIAAGIVALFGQSVYEVFSRQGEGYFDSLAGLLFFLLCGKLFQQKTYERLAFDRDYKSFFPLSVSRKNASGEERISLSQLVVGDRIVIRNGELIPADARLLDGSAVIDYSFVTGESEPVEKKAGDYLYAGGRQMGAVIEVEIAKAVSQSYLTSLWEQDIFRKEKRNSLLTITNQYSQRFTRIVIAIALGAAFFWAWKNPNLALKSFTSVLIVACPCALALAAPFTLGTAHRLLARCSVFLKNAEVIETLARVDTIVFDKTGTLTAAGARSVSFEGIPLDMTECRWIFSLARQSTHPYAARIAESIRSENSEPLRSFSEVAGCGIEALVAGHEICIGSTSWLEAHGVKNNSSTNAHGGLVHVAIDGNYRGCFVLRSELRSQIDGLIQDLSRDYRLALLSGDNEKERESLQKVFGQSSSLHFHQSPTDKLEFVTRLQAEQGTVMMVGDGLNDAGALKKSDAGVAVVENVSAFSPASDVIMAAAMVPRLNKVLRFSRQTMRVVRWSFLVSTVYNVIGISIAASGHLSPIVCAILMPLSSVSVIAFACGVTSWMGRRAKFPEAIE